MNLVTWCRVCSKLTGVTSNLIWRSWTFDLSHLSWQQLHVKQQKWDINETWGIWSYFRNRDTFKTKLLNYYGAIVNTLDWNSQNSKLSVLSQIKGFVVKIIIVALLLMEIVKYFKLNNACYLFHRIEFFKLWRYIRFSKSRTRKKKKISKIANSEFHHFY